MRIFSAKIPPTLQRSNLFDSSVWLASIEDARKKSLIIKIKSYSVEPASK